MVIIAVSKYAVTRHLCCLIKIIHLDRFSGAIEISSMMYMDAGVSKSGLKMVSTMHSSTAIEGKVQLKDGKIFTTSISMPRDKIEILDVR